MKKHHDYNLTLTAVAEHFGLTSHTIRTYLKTRKLAGVRIGGEWRCSWPDVWAAEKGPEPKGARAEAYKKPLLSKRDLAAKWEVCERTIERRITDGLPTRNVFGNVRIACIDADDWVKPDILR